MRRADSLLSCLIFLLSLTPHSLGQRSEVWHAGRVRGPAGGRRLAAEPPHVAAAVQRYLDNEELGQRLEDYAQRCNAISKLYTIGQSVEGRPIWALEVSDKPGQAEAEPSVKFVGNVHGDEPTGRVFTLALAEWLCANRRTDETAKRIIEKLHVWLVPTMNPDGYALKTRENRNGKDLNRDFPDRFSETGMERTGQEQPETLAIMDWTLQTGFTASASIHEGALVANYPWDGTPNRTTAYQACPDDATFKHLASVYATSHRSMSRPDNTEFPNGGITNGAAWYPIYGSMQDWNYIVASCLELTLELSIDKWPPEDQLAGLWQDNRQALLAFAWAASYGGLWGTVMESAGKLRDRKGQELHPAGGANITVVGVGQGVLARPKFGDFYRPLAPGEYHVIVQKPGFKPAVADVTVPADGSGVRYDFVLEPAKQGRPGKEIAAGSSDQQAAAAAQQVKAGGKAVERSRMRQSAAVLLVIAGIVLVAFCFTSQVRMLHRRRRRNRVVM